MANILFIGGTGQISLPCVELALAAGHKVAVFNRGQRDAALPAGVESIVGDMKDPASYAQLGRRDWDVVAQFMVFTPAQMQQDIDVFTGHKTPRQKAKLEIFGILFFAIPYCLVATYYAFFFAEVSFLQNERSDAPNGLEWRWIIKSCLFLGLLLLDVAVISVMFRKLVMIFGPPDLAARASTPAVGQ